MAVERVSGRSSLIDVLDRVLDKGIVIDAWVRMSLAGIDLTTVDSRVVVAYVGSHLTHVARAASQHNARPQFGAIDDQAPAVISERTRRTTVRPARKARKTAASRG